MSKAPRRTSKAESNYLRAEYRLDYSKAKPNRFAGRMVGDVVAVILEPDVAAVVKSSAKANAMLRSVLAGRPRKPSVRPRGHRRQAG